MNPLALSTDLLFPYFENNHLREINFSPIIPKSELSSLLPGIAYPVTFRGCSAVTWTEMDVPEEVKTTPQGEAALWGLSVYCESH